MNTKFREHEVLVLDVTCGSLRMTTKTSTHSATSTRVVAGTQCYVQYVASCSLHNDITDYHTMPQTEAANSRSRDSHSKIIFAGRRHVQKSQRSWRAFPSCLDGVSIQARNSSHGRKW